MAIIIIEGPDGSGKTTLANQLRSLTDRHLCILRRTGPPTSVEEMWKLLQWTMACPPNLTLIMDRYPLISEKIYGPVIRGHDRLPRLNRTDVCQWLLTRKDIGIINCRPVDARIQTNVQKSDQMEGVKQHLSQIIQMYDSWMYAIRQSGVCVRDYNYELQNPQLVLTDLLRRITHESDTNRPDLQSPDTTGNPVREH